jgi:hypothetical protein
MFCAGYQLVHPISMIVAFSLANFSMPWSEKQRFCGFEDGRNLQ